jgi:hypothetical protein
MANWFEDLSKSIADEKLPRRTAMRRVAGGIAGVALAAGIPGIALAKASPDSALCSPGGTCAKGYVNCGTNPNCFCFGNKAGAGRCGCDAFCSSLTVCASTHDCAAGQFCSYGTCCTSPNVCVTKCVRANKNCVLSSSHSGPTAARG